MILDLTRRPILILQDQCPGTVVVRTFHTRDADGRIYVKREHEEMKFLKPGASLQRGAITCMETQLNLWEALGAYAGKNNFRKTVKEFSFFWTSGTEKYDLDLSAEPYEVATGSKDGVTGGQSAWRAAIYIQRYKGLWFVTVQDISGDKPFDLCTVGTRDLSVNAQVTDFPLLRLTKKIVGKPQNAWEHLLSDE